ncbi:hypothetical protein ACQR1I_21895 [Bradyrhizobium sp. HKCCYLS2038]|uniref:hypothetical protein n=1 Tax=unclassified Bradyrhizobium TaxID=2631580 RepID=UPI003EC12293
MILDRRYFIGGALSCLFVSSGYRCASAQVHGFDVEFTKLLSNENLLAKTQEFGRLKEEVPVARGTVRSRERSDRKISQRSINLIVAFEVTSKSVYEKKYQGVIKPGGASGITIGIGYDVGYVSPEFLQEDWKGYIPDSDIKTLSMACDVIGNDANNLRPKLSNIRVPWDVANRQFLEKVLPVYVAATLNSLSNANELSDDSLGALVSLVYNRGPSFRNVGPRYTEMRRISRLMADKSFSSIPEQFLAMRRLWTTPDVIGVATRRQLEALLFKEGLNA